jgi:L-lactate dehydrogenase
LSYTVTFIGFGNVGRACAFLMSSSAYEFKINIIDPGEWISGAVLDLGSSLEACKRMKFSVNDYDLIEKSDFIVYSAGIVVPKGESRFKIVKEGIKLTYDIFEPLKIKPDAKVIVISNPVDAIAYHTWKVIGCDPKNIIGTGTWVDQIRLDYYLKTKHGIESDNGSVRIIGEHGETMVFLENPLSQFGLSADELEQLRKLTVGAANEIRKTQDYTYYGVGRCTYEIILSFLEQKNWVLPLTVFPSEPYHSMLPDKELFISLPVSISNKTPEVLDFTDSMTEQDKAAFARSARFIADHL